MKLFFDLQWIRNIGAKNPWLARLVEMLLYAVYAQIALVLAALLTALGTKEPIQWLAIISVFNWREVVTPVIVAVLASINKAVQENRRATESNQSSDGTNQ